MGQQVSAFIERFQHAVGQEDTKEAGFLWSHWRLRVRYVDRGACGYILPIDAGVELPDQIGMALASLGDQLKDCLVIQAGLFGFGEPRLAQRKQSFKVVLRDGE